MQPQTRQKVAGQIVFGMQKKPCSTVMGIETTEHVCHPERSGGDRDFLISSEPPKADVRDWCRKWKES